MKKNKLNYGWVLKFLLAAILLGVGIYFFFAKEVVYTITWAAIVIFSIFRVVPLLKTLNKEVLRTINLIEIIFDILIGVFLIYIALSGKMHDNAELWSKFYKYALAFFFYSRAVIYLTSVTFFEEKTDVAKFISHLIFITIGTVIATHPKFDDGTVALFLSIVSFAGTVYLSFDGYKNYKIYRELSAQLNEGVYDDVDDSVNDEIEDSDTNKKKKEKKQRKEKSKKDKEQPDNIVPQDIENPDERPSVHIN